MRRLLVLITGLIAALAVVGSPAASATVDNHSGGPIVVIDADVTVGPEQEADGVYMVHGHARIAGRVSGDVVIVSGDLHLSGRIDGDLVMVSGRAYLARGASVSGDLTYGDEEPRIAHGARVGGDVNKEHWSDVLGLTSIIGAVVLWLAIGISFAVLGILLLVLSPRAADAVFAQAQERFWTAVGIGVGIAVAVPIAILVAAVTVVGLPLSIALGLAILPFAAVAYVTAAWTLGRVIVKPPRSRIPAFLAGLAILRLAALVPVAGLLVGLATVIAGLGLLGAAIAAARQPAEAHAWST